MLIQPQHTFLAFIQTTRLSFIPASYSMTRIAVVRISMTKPHGQGTTPFTLEIDVITTMLLTVGLPSAHHSSRTLRTHQIFLVKCLCVLLVELTIFQAAEVRFLTLVALIISAFIHGPGLKVPMHVVSGVQKLGILIYTFMLASLHGFLNNFLLYLQRRLQHFHQLWTV